MLHVKVHKRSLFFLTKFFVVNMQFQKVETERRKARDESLTLSLRAISPLEIVPWVIPLPWF